MTPPQGSAAAEPRKSSAVSQSVAVNITEPGPDSPHRFQFEVSECVETRTVTTTTRLTRKFPQVFIRDPVPLESLDVKEYPLARKPTPPEIANFTYNTPVDEDDTEGEEIESKSAASHHYPQRSRAGRASPSAGRARPQSARDVSLTSHKASRPHRSPSEVHTRRTRATSISVDQSANTAPETRSSSQRPRSNLKAVSDKLRRSIIQGNSSNSDNTREADGIPRTTPGCLATPNTPEVAGTSSGRNVVSRPRSIKLEPGSPSLAGLSSGGSSSASIFGSNVATPPITDADVEPFGQTDHRSIVPLHIPRPTIDVTAAQDASLPSPRLSPTLAASQLPLADNDGSDPQAQDSFQTVTTNSNVWDDSQTLDSDSLGLFARQYRSQALAAQDPESTDQPMVLDVETMLKAFDSMKSEMKTFMMYQFLRRCARPTLRVVANAVNPALKCDFFSRLPLELCYQILSYLDHKDLCRAAQTSKQWRNIVDRNETGWKELLERDGLVLPRGELTKAIVQGWGWQDPAGSHSFERDLSMHDRLTLPDHELTQIIKQEPDVRTRRSKRKRGLNSYTASERLKRRAGNQESVSSRDDKAQGEVRQHKSEGPISAANAAATAVPDPHIGLSSLRQLHLFKSLYRRHYMIRRSWMSGEVKPSHVAFTAHPRHVVTCLQFDDDKIITGSDDTFIHIYDTKTGKLRNKLAGHEGGVWALQYEGNILVSGSTDRSVRVWDIERGLCQQVFYGHTSTVRCLQILMPTETGRDVHGKAIMQPEKPLIITGSRDSQLRVWRLPEVGSRRYYQTGLPSNELDCPYFVSTLSGHTHSVRAIAAYGDTLVSGSYDSVVRVWRVSTGECVHVLHGHTQKVYSVILDHKRNRCISGSMDSLVKIWDLTTGACLYTLEGHSLLVGLLDLRDDRLVSAAADATLRVWDPETGRCRNTLMAHTGAITCFQHDGSKVISGSEKTVKMWDVATGECMQDLLTDLSGVWQVKFDGRRCVAAVQRDQLTYIEILDFGAVRDGQPPETLGKRILLNEDDVQAIMQEEP